MEKICEKGFKINSVDKKALDAYLAETPKEWAKKALKGMINKAVKTILRDYFELYKLKKTGNITSDFSAIISEIIAMEEFKPYNYQTPTKFDKFDKNDPEEIQRDEPCNNEIWSGGFDIEDYEEAALNAYYSDYEAQLDWFMNNKIYRRKLAFVKEHEKEMIKNHESFPSRHDAFINHVTSKQGYKNRVQRDEEELDKL